MLVQTSRPLTRNLFGKTHDADGGGATDNGTDDGVHDTSDDVNESAMKIRLMTILGRGREHDDCGNGCDDDEDGNSGGDDRYDDGAEITEPTKATTLTMLMSICR